MSTPENNSLGGELSHPSVAFDSWVEGVSTEGAASTELPGIKNHAFDTSSDQGPEARFPYGQTAVGDEIIDARDIHDGPEQSNKILHEHLVVRGTVQLGLRLNAVTNEPEPIATFITTRRLPASHTSDDVFIRATERIIQVPLYMGDKDEAQKRTLLRTIQEQGLKRLVVDMKVIPGYAVGEAEDTQYGAITDVYASEELYQLDDPMPPYGTAVVIQGTVAEQRLTQRGDDPSTISLDVDGQQITIDSPRTYAELDKQVNLDNPQAGIEPPNIRVGDTVQVSVYPTADGESFSTQPQVAQYYNYSPDITKGRVPAFYFVKGSDERLEASLEAVESFNARLAPVADAESAEEFRQAIGDLLIAYVNLDPETQTERPFLLSTQQLEAIDETVRANPHAVRSGPHAPIIPIVSPNRKIKGNIKDYYKLQWAFGDYMENELGGTVFSISRVELVALSREYISGNVVPEYSKDAGKLLAVMKDALPANYREAMRTALTPENLTELCGQPKVASQDLTSVLRNILNGATEWVANDPSHAEHLMQAYSHLLDLPQKSIVDSQLDTMLHGLRNLVNQAAEFKQPLGITNDAENDIVALKNSTLAVVVLHSVPILDKLDKWFREVPRQADEMVNNPQFRAIRSHIKTSAHYLEEVATLRWHIQRLADYQPQEKWRFS